MGAPSAHLPATTRRQFIAAAPVVAVAVSIPTVAMASPARPWDVCMERLLKADAACREYDAAKWTPAYNREKAFEASHGLRHGEPGYWERRKALIEKHPGYLLPERIADEYERLVEVYTDAEDALMAMPAPDRAALRWKLDRIFEVSGGSESVPSWTRRYLAPTIADYQRLLGSA